MDVEVQAELMSRKAVLFSKLKEGKRRERREGRYWKGMGWKEEVEMEVVEGIVEIGY